MYAIVDVEHSHRGAQDVEDESTAIISQRWFVDCEEDSCFWPPSKPGDLAKKLHPASQSWAKHGIRVLGKAGKPCTVQVIIYCFITGIF